MSRLSHNFSLAELTHSETAVRKGLNNEPGAEVLENLKFLAMSLEQVRSLLGAPIMVSSGYRSTEVNAAVGGSANSAHCRGLAADFIAPAFGNPLDIATEIAASDLAWDQLIHEGKWIHLSVAPTMRRQVLTAHFDNGRVRYTAGLAA